MMSSKQMAIQRPTVEQLNEFADAAEDCTPADLLEFAGRVKFKVEPLHLLIVTAAGVVEDKHQQHKDALERHSSSFVGGTFCGTG